MTTRHRIGTPSSFKQALPEYLRRAAIVVAVVTFGLSAYALANNEEVQWMLVLLVLIGMLGSAVVNAWYDSRRRK